MIMIGGPPNLLQRFVAAHISCLVAITKWWTKETCTIHTQPQAYEGYYLFSRENIAAFDKILRGDPRMREMKLYNIFTALKTGTQLFQTSKFPPGSSAYAVADALSLQVLETVEDADWLKLARLMQIPQWHL